jgi:rare lipoprotein A
MRIYHFLLQAILAIAAMPLAAQFNSYYQSDETGYAVYYADYLHGKSTSLGETYRKDELTCAHQSHPLGTLLKVTRLDNNQSVTVRVNDRGPTCDGCVVQLSLAAAAQIDLIKAGRTRVRVEVAGHSNTNPVNTGRGTARNLVAKSAYDNLPASYFDGGLQTKGATQVANVNDVKYLPPSSSGYVIQIGSYRDITNASRQVIELQKKGLQGVYIREDRGKDGSALNRVVIGVFTDYGRAQGYLDGLKEGYFLDGVITQLK